MQATNLAISEKNVLDRDSVIDGFYKAIQFGRRRAAPYLHFEFRPFSPALYAEMIRNLPDNSAYMELKHAEAMRPDGTSSRLVLPFKDEALLPLPAEQREFWSELKSIMCGDEIRQLFLESFESELVARFELPISDVPAIPKLMLMRDLAAYKINIHHDIHWKTITTQYYLPSDESQVHLGTGIYERRGPGDFVRTHKIEFAPGNSYAFAVSKNSWHAVEPVGDIPKPRNSMMMIYFREPGYDY